MRISRRAAATSSSLSAPRPRRRSKTSLSRLLKLSNIGRLLRSANSKARTGRRAKLAGRPPPQKIGWGRWFDTPAERRADATGGPLPCQSAGSISRLASPLGLAAAEQPLDVAERERHIGRAAVIALATIGGGLHLAQQGVHLGGVQAIPGADARMAGQGAADMLDPLLQGQRVAPFL